jgi:hypothetical protein
MFNQVYREKIFQTPTQIVLDHLRVASSPQQKLSALRIAQYLENTAPSVISLNVTIDLLKPAR